VSQKRIVGSGLKRLLVQHLLNDVRLAFVSATLGSRPVVEFGHPALEHDEHDLLIPRCVEEGFHTLDLNRQSLNYQSTSAGRHGIFRGVTTGHGA
jgi:hypothetical protein